MIEDDRIGVVVPAYNEADHIGEVIETMPAFVDRIYAVDDASTDETWEIIRQYAQKDSVAPDRSEGNGRPVDGDSETGGTSTVVPIRHDENCGVGGAIKTGYQRALSDDMDVTAVMAGDGQMPPELLAEIVRPIVAGHTDYVKGNRHLTPNCRTNMPSFRYVGSNFLSHLTRISTGYWGVGDSQNGFTAISGEALHTIDVDTLYEDYGFANHLLARLYRADASVVGVAHEPVYGDEQSDIDILRFVPRLSVLLLQQFLKRVMWEIRSGDCRPVTLGYTVAVCTSVAAASLTTTALLRRDTRVQELGSLLVVGGLGWTIALLIDRQMRKRRSNKRRRVIPMDN